MSPIVMDTTLVRADWDALNHHIRQRVVGESPWLRAGIGIAAGAALLCAFALGDLLRRWGVAVEPFGALIGVIVWIVLGTVWSRQQLKLWRPRDSGSILGPVRYEFDEAGIRSTRPGASGFLEWSLIEAVEEAPDHLFLVTDRIAAYMVPKRDLSAESLVALKELARSRTASVRTKAASAGHDVSAVVQSSAPAAITHDSPTFRRSLLRNLRSGLRMLAFRRVRPDDLVANFDQAFALGLMTLAAALLFDWLRAEAGAGFFVYGLVSWVYYVGIGLLACFVIARAQSARADTTALLVAMFAVAPYLIAMLWAVDTFLAPYLRELAANLVMGVLALIYAAQALRAAYGSPKAMAGLATAVVVALITAFGPQTLFFGPTLWFSPPDEEELAQEGADSERLLFEQPERIAAAVERTAPGKPGETDVFFVGFAGHGYQSVFRNEALFAAKAFADRYGSGSRSVELINDEGDFETYPVASVSGMRYALKHLGARMNRDEDVLILMLTSHGSSEGELSVFNDVLPLAQLRGPDVRSALDDAGIKWRVVIVSACYAGLFIEPLKSPDTMVITAADATHNSFGCADERELTYFGEAFLRDALPGAGSLAEAFEAARQAIAGREAAEGKEHSNPQLFAGDRIVEKLSALEAARHGQ